MPRWPQSAFSDVGCQGVVKAHSFPRSPGFPAYPAFSHQVLFPLIPIQCGEDVIMKKLLYIPIVAVVLAGLAGCGFLDRLDMMTERMKYLGDQMAESNRRLANVEEATVKMAKALP
jgi:hypothetical protein